MAAYVEIVDIEDGVAAEVAGNVAVRLSSVPPNEWIGFFGQAWILAIVEGAIPSDFGQGACVKSDRILIPNASREAVARQLEALRRIVAETNRITAGYQGLLERSHEPH